MANNTENPLAEVPSPNQSAWFTDKYKRYSWDATVYLVYRNNGAVHAYVSDYTFVNASMADLQNISTRIEENVNTLRSVSRLRIWADQEGMYFRTVRELPNTQLEVIA